MAKKRNCRRNANERINHERAVALRKMTDDQLVEHVDQVYKSGYSDGQGSVKNISTKDKDLILAAVARFKGIGETTMAKIRCAIGNL